MKIYIKFILIVCLITNIGYSQNNDIKRIIYDDLYKLNALYDSCLIQFEQNVRIVKKDDTVHKINTVNTLKASYDSIVSVVNIDSSNLGFYFVEVEFNLIFNIPNCYDFYKNSFEYTLYKSPKGQYYKVDGFLVSELLYINELSAGRLKKQAKINAPTFLFTKYFKKKNAKNLSKYLSISFFKVLNKYGYNFDQYPYVKNTVCVRPY